MMYLSNGLETKNNIGEDNTLSYLNILIHI
nr:MAG TPA: hypothetical protein [Caudoviricetes sp.]